MTMALAICYYQFLSEYIYLVTRWFLVLVNEINGREVNEIILVAMESQLLCHVYLIT